MNGSAMTLGYDMDSSHTKNTVPTDKSKQFQMELLMEKLRTKTSPYKTLMETSKAVRMTMLDKRWALDSADKSILQKCLDNLQHCIKVSSLQSLVERLECLSRQLGLKFVLGSSGVDLFISSDMFYLEILLEPSGAVKDVKIHHEGKVEQQSCEELVQCISRGDFADFTSQLEGLTAVYQLNAEKKVKCKAFTALTALETDLGTLAQMQSYIKDPWAQVHKTPIGFVQKRRGGHAMRLTYFVSPYDIIQCPGNTLTMENLTSGIGLSAQVQLESAAAHKLQLAPLLIPPRLQANSPTYAPLGPMNSITLPARFILKLSKPMPICGILLKMMNIAGESESPHLSADSNVEMKPLLSLIAQNAVSQPVNPSKGLFVTLNDQNQCYFLTESRGLDGCIVESVPFTHPRQVPVLIARLRQQAVFNALIASCVRPNSKQDLESSIMVEVSALSWQHISVMLEQPGEGGMATLEIELPEGNPPHVSLHAGNGSMGQPDEKLARVLARSLSIPLTVRALLARWERESHQGFSGGTGGLDPGGAPPDQRYSHHQGNFLGESQQNLSMFGNQDNNLASLMGNGASMSMQTNQMSQQLQNQQIMTEEKRSKKRKHDSSSWGSGASKKHKRQGAAILDTSSSSSDSAEDSDAEDDMMQSDSSNNQDDDELPSPSSQIDFVSDLELSGLDPSELIGGSSNDNKTSCSEYENSVDGEINELQEMEEMIRSSKTETKKFKHRSKESSGSKMTTSSLLLELTDGSSSMVPSALSITPISSAAGTNTSPNFSSALSGMNIDRRPSIASLPSSITITPITPSQAKSMDERYRSEKKSSSSGKSSRSSSSDRLKEKKKKKRREDSMGPPVKLPPKQDSTSKSLSSNLKPGDGSHSPLTIRSSSPNTLIRKFSPSPTHGRSVSSSKSSSGSPSGMKNINKTSGSSSHHSSPRHSPVQCSPKHTFPGYSSPKNHGTSSPKHGSSSTSTGKPSMSTLKSATSGSPSGKSSSSGYELSKLSKISSSKDGSSSKEKERKSSGGLSYSSSGSSSPKLKSSSVKLKQLDLSTSVGDAPSNINSDSSISPGLDLSKSSTSNQLRNRKGSLSAVIDKLKSAQHCGTEIEIASSKSSSGSSSTKDRISTSSTKLSDSKSGSSSSSKFNDGSKTQEYMVKPSSDGIKITINKTKTKDSSGSTTSKSSFSSTSSTGFSSSSSNKQSSSSQPASNTGSPKTHTGLKPGVISGPASKKPQVMQSTKSTPIMGSSSSLSGSPNMGSMKTSSSSLSGGSSSSSKNLFMKSSSSSNMSSSSSTQKSSSKVSTGSPKMSSSSMDSSKLNRDKDKMKVKSSSSSSLSDKSIFSSSKSGERRLSPAPSRDEVDSEKSLKNLTKDANFTVEGLIKSLDTSKYQIPKLSARMSNDDPNKPKSTSSSEKSTSQSSSAMNDPSNIQNRTPLNESAPKLLEYMGRQQDLLSSKFSFQHLANNKLNEQIQKQQTSTAKPIINISGTSPKHPMSLLTSPKSEVLESFQPTNMSFSNLSKSQSDSKGDLKLFDVSNRLNQSQQMMGLGRPDDLSSKLDFSKNFSSLAACNADSQKQMDKGFPSQKKSPSDEMNRKFPHTSHDLSMKPPLPKHSSTSQENTEGLLDFSSTGPKGNMDMKNKLSSSSNDRSNVKRHTPPLASSAQIPSLSVHIVKSPAQSPLIIPSPHSNSPCITDDELMDEAVVGPGK